MLRSAGYDPTTETLELEFEAGTVYQYSSVPEFTYRALMAAKSKGRFFATSIDGRFNWREVKSS
ncbi:MAG: KTSC domain-containing protein [Vicinamibacterales bacterium]